MIPPRLLVRVALSWLAVTLAFAATLVGPATVPPEALLVVTTLWGAVSCAGLRAALFLGVARLDERAVKLDERARPHRLWRGGVVALALGAPLGAAVASLGLVTGTLPSTWGLWAAALGATALLALALASTLAKRSLSRARAPRRASLAGWILVDTALPAGAIAGALGAVIARVRFLGVEEVGAVEASRHVAVTLLCYGLLLGLAGALKTARERSAGLVDVTAPAREPPGALGSAALLGLVVLVVWPRVGGPVDVGVLVIVKVLLGVVVGSALCALGALRGAVITSRA